MGDTEYITGVNATEFTEHEQIFSISTTPDGSKIARVGCI